MSGAGLVLTCEHGGNEVPRTFAASFSGARAQAALASHRGWDEGALHAAQRVAKALAAPLVFAETTRLLCDLNRSEGRPGVFSEFSRDLDGEAVLAFWHRPYRAQVEREIRRVLKRRRSVLHLSLHSFTPQLYGHTRETEIGVLYDPRRPPERRLGAELATAIRTAARARGLSWRVRRNYPYKGWTDGLTTCLRRVFPATRYAGIELEMNQKLVRDRQALVAYAEIVAAALAELGFSG